MTEAPPRRRPGGRSQAVREAVHTAVRTLLEHQPADDLRMADVAQQAGIHPASLYRRWGNVRAIVADMIGSELETLSPLPDTGSLRDDLYTYARQLAHALQRPDGLMFFQAIVTATHAQPDGEAATDQQLNARVEQLQALLERARDRQEKHLDFLEVLDGLLAPLYLRALLGIGGMDDTYLSDLIDRLLR